MTLTDLLIVGGFLLNTGIVVGLFYGHVRECNLFRQMIREERQSLKDHDRNA
jgi:hypothetical protein